MVLYSMRLPSNPGRIVLQHLRRISVNDGRNRCVGCIDEHMLLSSAIDIVTNVFLSR